LALGSDGALWFTQDLSDNPNEAEWVGVSTVGRIAANGAVTLYPLAAGAGDVALGPDGNLWFIQSDDGQGASALVSVTPTGQMTAHPLPPGAHGSALTVGPDGNI
jgi:streptogramin lyase